MAGSSRVHTDILIVGAGSAGSVLAERLSADPDCRVTVLEAGPAAAAPGIGALTGNGLRLPLHADSPVVARFDTTLTDHPPRGAQLIRGATVGGSGAVNGGYFCRAVPADIAQWGLPGWSWPEVLRHYRAIETDLDYPDSPAHGDAGPIPIRRVREMTGVTASFAEAAGKSGLPWLPDLNDGASANLPTGIGAVPSNIVDGVRTGPGAAFLAPALARPNLTVHSGVRATRIRVEAGRAVGVETSGGLFAADRIVLSAGAIGSAHLLMLSGVGDEATLRAAGVPVLAPVPVGTHCADHPEWLVPTDWPASPGGAVLEVVLSLAEGIEIRPYTTGFAAMTGTAAPGQPDPPHLGVALMKPAARARLTLRSADPAVLPGIAHHYDGEPADIAALRHGAALARELAGAASEDVEPQWSTSQHLCGTARMGADDDPDAVTDARCRVRGVAGLWVIDGAVLPQIPSRGPHATTVMLAHRAAEFVAAD